MRLFFYCANKNFSQVAFNEPENGNPGCGATEYLQVAIPYFLNKYFPKQFEISIIAEDISTMPNDINSYQVSDGLKGAIELAYKKKSDIFIFKPSMNEDKSIFELLENLQLKSIAIGQLTPTPKCLSFISRCKSLKAFVCVGLNQYDQLIDTCIRNKIVNINNAISDKLFDKNLNLPFHKRKDIVFMGALFPQKNFLYLAECWRFINKKLPETYLHVLGSARTYGQASLVGKNNLADQGYEEMIFNELNKDPKSANKVIFHGNLKEKKYQIITESRVGIVNPLGTTETCCVSAVEMQALGTPVCTGNYQALKTTILDKKSGLLSNSKKSFIRNVVNIYSNEKIFNALSKGSIINSKLNFSFSHIIWNWYSLIYKVNNDYEVKDIYQPSIIRRKVNFINFLRYLNLVIGKRFLFFKKFSILDIIYYMERIIDKVKKLFFKK